MNVGRIGMSQVTEVLGYLASLHMIWWPPRWLRERRGTWYYGTSTLMALCRSVGEPDIWEVSLCIHSFTNSFTHPFIYAGTVSLVPGMCCKVLVGRGGHTTDVLRSEGWGHSGCLLGQISISLLSMNKVNRMKFLV